MNILAVITALFAAHPWSTSCVMTQSDGVQGYTIDQVLFERDRHAPIDPKIIEVSFKRTWFEDENCNQEKSTSSETGELLIGARLNQSMNQNTFEADWTINGKVQLGAISLSDDGKTLKMATSSFGTSRNTMLSLFSYSAK